MKEHHLTVPKTARYYTLGDTQPGTTRVGFVCHGYRQLAADFLESFRGLDDRHSLIVAPEGLSRFYAESASRDHSDIPVCAAWMTREDRTNEINDYVNYLDVLYARILSSFDRSKSSVFALGFSQGAATVCRWVAQGVADIDHVILWGGLVPPDMDLATKKAEFQRLRLTVVVGDKDPLVTDAHIEAQEQRLTKNGIEHAVVRFAGGHTIDDATLQQVLNKKL